MPLLWKLELIQNNTSPSFVYIFGTMHSSTPVAINKVSQVQHLLNQCIHYYGESDLDHVLFTQLNNKQIKEWTGLQNHLTPGGYHKARHLLLLKSGMDLDHIQAMPPMILNTIISEQLLPKSDQLPLDLMLWNYAKKIGLTMHGLESAEEQNAIYRKIPLKYQIKQLKESIKHLSKSRQQLKTLSLAYHQEDLNKLFQLSRHTLGPVRALLLTQRNMIMAERIAHIVDQGVNSFIAIGAAHLPGLYGVLRLLKRKGMAFKPSKYLVE